MGENKSLINLINVDLLRAMFDEWMRTQFHTISASGDKIIVIDKNGNRTETNDLATAAKTAKSEWDNTYKVQIVSATSNANTATSNANTATTNANTATSAANSAASAAATATTEAERVNANLTGMTVTVTDRNGVSTSVNIGFEIKPEHVYASYAAMVADTSSTKPLAGEFCMIATTDPTSAENARLYSKNSQGGFTFLSDLDQASTSAWADWMDNYKPVIESDHTRAEGDHTTATTDHATAESDTSRASTDHQTASVDHTTAASDHTTAVSDHAIATQDNTTAQTDHTTAETDHTTAESDHTRAESDHSTASDDHTQATADHLRAESDHTTADSDHTQAGTDHTESVSATQYANEQGDYAKDWNDHPPFIGNGTTGDLNYWYIYDITTEQYVRAAYAKGDNLDWDNMTPAEKQRLIDEVLQSLEDFGFDAVPTEGSTKPVRSGGIYDAIHDEETRAKAAEQTNADDIDAIEALIPSAATTSNQLADKAFVNSSIATATATFRGTYNLVSDLNLSVSATQAQIATALGTTILTADNNDYCYVQIPTADSTPTEIAKIDRYKYDVTAWEFEYSLNNSGFTAQQWEAINSTITSVLVAKLTALPTNAELTALIDAKQDNLTFASDATCESVIDELT